MSAGAFSAVAEVPTASGSRYLQQLCKHWSHKFTTDFTPEQGTIALPLGLVRMLALGDERADVGARVARVADLEVARHLGQRVHHLVVAIARGEDAGLGHAGLTVVHERGALEAGGDHREIGVVEHDRGGLAAELEADSLQLLAAD